MRYSKKITSLFLVGSLLLTGLVNGIKPAYAANTTFQNEEKAKVLHELGLFNGTSQSGFEPDLGLKLNREQGITMIIRLLGKVEAADALTPQQVEGALKQFKDGEAVEQSLKKPIAFAIINNLIKGDGANIMPDEPMSGRDFATLILRNLGYKDDEFKYETACSDLADKKGIPLSLAVVLNNKELTRDDLVGMAYSSLNTVDKEGKTIIDKLIADKPEIADIAKKVGVLSNKESTPAPSATPTIIPSAAPVYNEPRESVPSSTPTSIPAQTPANTPLPEVTPTPVPEVTLDFEPVVIGVYKIQLAFNKVIDFSKADVIIKKDNLDTVISNTYSSDDSTKITVILPAKVTSGEYSITVEGLENKTITKNITAQNERVERIAFLSTKAYINPNDRTEVTAHFRAYNQYNEEYSEFSLYNFFFTSTIGSLSIINKNTGIIKNYVTDFILGQKVTISVVHAPTGVFSTAVLEVGEMQSGEINPVNDMSQLRMRFPKGSLITNDLDTTNKSIIGEVHMYDEYFNDVTQQYKNDSRIYLKTSKGQAGSIDENGKFIIASDNVFSIGESVTVSVYLDELGISVTNILPVRKSIALYEGHFKGIYNKDNKELTVTNMSGNKFYLLFEASSELGIPVTDLTAIQTKFIINQNNPLFFTTSNQFVNISVNGKNEIAMEIIPAPTLPLNGGDTEISVINIYSGVLSKFKVTVKDGPKYNVVDIILPSAAIAGELVNIPYTAYDDNGSVINDLDSLSKVTLTSSVGQLYFKLNELTGKIDLILDLTSIKTSGGVMINATTQGTTKYPSQSRNLFIKVNAPGPIVITGLDDNITRNLSADGGSVRISPNYIKTLDIIGRDFNLNGFISPEYRIKIRINNTDVISFSKTAKSDIAYIAFDGINNYPYIYAVGSGKSLVRFSIEQNGIEIYSSTYMCEFSVF